MPIDLFPQVCAQQQLPQPVAEFRFHASRKWRFDYAWPTYRVALEVEGGVWTGGAHGRGTGITRDIEKYNYAAAMGWLVIRCTPSKKLTAETFAFLRAAIARATFDTSGPGYEFEPTVKPITS